MLEIGAGTGQHAAAFALAFPHLTWIASDPDAHHRASIAAWAAHLGTGAPPPLALDAAGDWALDADVRALGRLSVVYSMNVLHIAPLSVARGLIRGAADRLSPGGLLILYGPFFQTGVPASPGNLSFDAGLRAENPDWGIRDLALIEGLAAAAGLGTAGITPMPANNLLVSFISTA